MGMAGERQGHRCCLRSVCCRKSPCQAYNARNITKEKRIVGGFMDIERILPRDERWKRLLRDLLPPIKPLFQINTKKDLSLLEKIVAGSY